MSVVPWVPLRTTPSSLPPLTSVGADGVRPQGLVLYQACGHIDQDVLESGRKWSRDDFSPSCEPLPQGGGGTGAELGRVGDGDLGGPSEAVGGSGNRMLLDFALAAPLPTCFHSSDATSSTKPSEPRLSLREPLCFSAVYIVHIADLLSIDPSVLLAFLPSSIPSLVPGLTKAT